LQILEFQQIQLYTALDNYYLSFISSDFLGSTFGFVFSTGFFSTFTSSFASLTVSFLGAAPSFFTIFFTGFFGLAIDHHSCFTETNISL
jgi:hypothetical protein